MKCACQESASTLQARLSLLMALPATPVPQTTWTLSMCGRQDGGVFEKLLLEFCYQIQLLRTRDVAGPQRIEHDRPHSPQPAVPTDLLKQVRH